MHSLIAQNILDAMLTVAETAPPGCFAEVGVYNGGSARLLYGLAERQRRKLHLFDTFSGMPYRDPSIDPHCLGDFPATVKLDELVRLMPYVVFHIGTFPDTCPAELGQIAFVHVDCDQYRSTLAVIDVLGPRMVAGGILWFDDFEVPGARQAILERFPRDSLTFSIEDRCYATF